MEFALVYIAVTRLELPLSLPFLRSSAYLIASLLKIDFIKAVLRLTTL